MVYHLESTTSEKVPGTVKTSADPTGALPEFALTTVNTEPTWPGTDGEWDGTWSATTREIDMLSPLVGDGAALDVAGGTDFDLWVRWTVGTETPAKLVDRLRVS